MNVKLKALTAGVLFFVGHTVSAQKVKKDSTSQKEKEIETVVILGYGKTSSKTKTSTASTTITAETFSNRPTTSFLNSIQGAAPGVSINSQSGSPGSGKIDIKVRGLSSLSASTEPLYVIDGLISTGTEYRNLNQNDIETLSILKDAQATAIYGNYGANGVVVITTKNARYNSGLKISYDVTTSFSNLPKHKYNLLSAQELLLVQNRLEERIAPNRKATVGGMMTLDEINNFATNTNWQDEFFRTSFTQNHNLGLRFGGENFAGYSSLGYLENEGIINNTDFKRFTFRTNINGRSANKRLTYSAQVALGYSKRNELQSETDDSISNNSVQNPLLGILIGAPFVAPFRGSGRELFNQYGHDARARGNSIWVLADNVNGGVRRFYTQNSITANGEVSYKITNDLGITHKTGVNYKHNTSNVARTPNGYLSVAVADLQGVEYGGWETFGNQQDVILNSVTSLNYNKKIGKHTLSLSAYLDYLRGFYHSSSQTQNGLDPLNWVLGAGTGYVPFNPAEPNKYQPSVSLARVKAGTLAYIGTLDYDFDSRYGVAATIRRDASYRFSKQNKWETFWSVSGRWNIDKESFMDGSIFDLLKLRASYGTNGNQNLGIPSVGVNPLFLLPNLVQSTYVGTEGYGVNPGYRTTLSNPDARWEKVSQANIGLDFALFDRKLEGAVDVYEKRTSDMYLSTPISGINGQYTITGNDGEMSNKGIEANLRYTPFKGDFRLSVYANLGYNKNKIISMPSQNLSTSLVNAIGETAYQWNLIEYVGVNKENGQYLFRKPDGTLTENPDQVADRRLTGKYAYAPYNGGFGFDVEYKGFYLTSAFSFQAGAWAFDAMQFWLNNPGFVGNGQNGTKDYLNAWTQNNTNTDFARLNATNATLTASSDRYLKKTDYIRLKNVSLGYSVNKDLLRNLPVKALKVYVMGENLLTWTKWNGFDPETAWGNSLGVYPNAKTYSVGLNLEF